LQAKHFFITGTDTGVGKTTFTCALLKHYKRQGLQTAALKPVASGCDLIAGNYFSADALQLQQHMTLSCAYSQVNPFALAAPVSPHIAARQMQIDISVADILQKSTSLLNANVDVLLVEGAGGWFTPINLQETMADLAKAINYPILLVVAIKLGCINHTLLTVEAIKASGLTLAGWVANLMDENMLAMQENIAYLSEKISAPLFATLDSQQNCKIYETDHRHYQHT
jgi:dethiobiotin synthetase